MYMKKIEELIASNTKLAELLGKKAEPEKKTHPLVWALAIIGAIAAIAGIAYAVYRYMNPNYFDDFDFDDIDDEEFEDDFEEDDIVEDVVTEPVSETAAPAEEN